MATVALTTLVALLADGSHREVQAEQAEPPQADAVQNNPRLLRRDSNRSANADESGDFYKESDDTFGAPMMRPVQAGGMIAPSRAMSGGTRSSLAGYSQAYLDSLSEEEYEALVEGLREAGMLDPTQREIQLAALERASTLRSGKARRD
ncbi:hypothetical protein ABDJ38_04300 [Aurantiacibacter sp. DGU5]|uniref:Uncharacterized protein n=2 Tax=Aurantiacibacter flavus TaxID=3145232 RepID=A0ABV0CU29_9SPHN